MSASVAEPDGVAGAQHDVIRAGASHHGLMEVVAHREVVGEGLQVGRIALQHVVEAHGGRAFTGGGVVEAGRLRLAIGASADRGLQPRATSRSCIRWDSLRVRTRGLAVELLPHLVEAVDRAVVVGVVRVGGGGYLERAVGQVVGIGDARVNVAMREVRCRPS